MHPATISARWPFRPTENNWPRRAAWARFGFGTSPIGRSTGDVQMSSQRIHALAYSADGKQLASGGDERVIRVIDTATAKAVVVLPAQPAKILSLALLRRESAGRRRDG